MLSINRPTHVAEGALSARYDTIDARDLPAGVSYAMVRDEPFNAELHRDCMEAGEQRMRPRKNKVLGYQQNDQPVVIDRMKIILAEGQVGGGKVDVPEWRRFAPLKGQGKIAEISFKLVFFKGHRFVDHDCALVDDHDASRKDNALRDGVKLWKEVTAEIVSRPYADWPIAY